MFPPFCLWSGFPFCRCALFHPPRKPNKHRQINNTKKHTQVNTNKRTHNTRERRTHTTHARQTHRYVDTTPRWRHLSGVPLLNGLGGVSSPPRDSHASGTPTTTTTRISHTHTRRHGCTHQAWLCLFVCVCILAFSCVCVLCVCAVGCDCIPSVRCAMGNSTRLQSTPLWTPPRHADETQQHTNTTATTTTTATATHTATHIVVSLCVLLSGVYCIVCSVFRVFLSD